MASSYKQLWHRETRPMTADSPSPDKRALATERLRRKYAKEGWNYDKEMDFWERWLFGSEHRGWACSHAVETVASAGSASPQAGGLQKRMI